MAAQKHGPWNKVQSMVRRNRADMEVLLLCTGSSAVMIWLLTLHPPVPVPFIVGVTTPPTILLAIFTLVAICRAEKTYKLKAAKVAR